MFTDLYIAAKVKWQHFCEEEDGIDGLVVAIILILVAIAAAVIFRQQLIGIINDWFGQIKVEDAQNLKNSDN